MYVKQQNYGVRKLWNRLSEKKQNAQGTTSTTKL